MTTPMEHAKIAIENGSGLYLTAAEAETLVTYITLLESEEKNLRDRVTTLTNERDQAQKEVSECIAFMLKNCDLIEVCDALREAGHGG